MLLIHCILSDVLASCILLFFVLFMHSVIDWVLLLELCIDVFIFLLTFTSRDCFLLIEVVLLQLRESISQDQEKTESLKGQMQDLENSIQNVDGNIHHTEATLKDLRKLQDQISIKTAQRSTLFKEQQKQYAALAEENEGLLANKEETSCVPLGSDIFL